MTSLPHSLTVCVYVCMTSVPHSLTVCVYVCMTSLPHSLTVCVYDIVVVFFLHVQEYQDQFLFSEKTTVAMETT